VGHDPLALGVVSVAARTLQDKGRGYLGVRIGSDDKGLKVEEVRPDSAAKSAGVQTQDRILEIDGQKPDSPFTFTKLVSERKAGDKVKLKLQRGDDVMEKEIQLGDRASLAGGARPSFDKMSALGSTVNKRKDDFASVIQTDLPVDANQCGGPVTDLDGNVLGIMIARSGRIESLMVPSATVREILDGVDALKK
jgi:S1-C subfamily serine protease